MPGVTYLSNYSQLNLAGTPIGFAKSVEGGSIRADVIETPAVNSFAKKHLGPPRYEAFDIEVDLSMSQALYDWITSFLSNKTQPKDGSIVACDYNFASIFERGFTGALITAVTFPALDASAKDSAYMRFTIAPETIRFAKGTGAKVAGPIGLKTEPAKLWLRSNFRLDIPGLDCSKVMVLDSFTISQDTSTASIGTTRVQTLQPGPLQIPNLKITVAGTSAQSWIDWHQDFVLKGNNDDGREKTGTALLLSADLQTELAKITFHNMGIFNIDLGFGISNTSQMRTVTAELYCERIDFQRLTT